MSSQNQQTRGENFEHPSNLEFEKKKCNVYSDGHITRLALDVSMHLAFTPHFSFQNISHIITDINRAQLHMSIPQLIV